MQGASPTMRKPAFSMKSFWKARLSEDLLIKYRQSRNRVDNGCIHHIALNNQSSVSPPMQKRLDRIDSLIKEGYTLKRNGWFDVQFHNSSGIRVNTLQPWKSPGGFSWIAFWFPAVVCCQIREWSYFYWLAIITSLSVVFASIFNNDSTNTGGFLLSLLYACLFPYMRYLAIEEKKQEFSVLTSFFMSIGLTIVAIIPAVVLAVILGVE